LLVIALVCTGCGAGPEIVDAGPVVPETDAGVVTVDAGLARAQVDLQPAEAHHFVV
jgi:hypothetical protein